MGVTKRWPGFGSLKGALEELTDIISPESVADHNGYGIMPGKLLLDKTFTWHSMKSGLRKRYSVVHIASHFCSRPGPLSDSFLLLGDGTHLSLDNLRASPDITFIGTDILVLSACDTSSSSRDADGNEVDGLANIVQYKGAKSTIATLWSVHDKSTALLMRSFYRLWVDKPGTTRASALRQAQLVLLNGKRSKEAAVLASKNHTIPEILPLSSLSRVPRFTVDPKAPFAHPMYWSPFVLTGSWR